MRRLYGTPALILAVALTAVAAAATIGGHGALVTVGLLAAIGAGSLVAAHVVVLARSRGRAGPLSRQFAFAVAIVIGPLLLALVVIGLLMFVSSHDAELVAVIVVFVGVIAVAAGQLLAAAIMRDVEAIRDGLAAVGRGERELRISTTGRDELGELADAANVMIEQLRTEEAARDQSDQARRGLVAAVSHDLRTPITSLALLADAVGDDIVDEHTRRSYLDRMRRSSACRCESWSGKRSRRCAYRRT